MKNNNSMHYFKKIFKYVIICMALISIVILSVKTYTNMKEQKIYKQLNEKVDMCINEKNYKEALNIVDNSLKDYKDKEGKNEKEDKTNTYVENLEKKKEKIEVLKDNAEYNEYIEKAESKEVEVTDDDRISAYTKAIDIKPQEDKPYIEAAQIYVQYNEYEKAVNLLASGIDACEEEKSPVAKATSVKLSTKIEEINDLMTNTEYNNKYLEAKKAYKENNMQEVELKYKECLAINKNDYRLYALMAKLYFKNSKYLESIKVLNYGMAALKKIGAHNKTSKFYKQYVYLTSLKKKFVAIENTSKKYSTFYSQLLSACKYLKEKDSDEKIIKVLKSYPFKTIAACNKATYYTNNGAFVESINNGTALVVYKSQYIYYGEWINGKKSGYGYLLALDKDGKNDITYMYKGNWRNNFPNGQGTVIYKKYKNNKLSYYTKTTGKYSNGYEDGDMTIVKKKSSNKTELKMSYKAIYGEPVILLEDGEPVKASDGTYVIGYYCDENGSKKEIASVKGKNGVADKVYWRVQGLPYSR